MKNSYINDTDSNEINSVEKAKKNKYINHSSVLLITSRLKNVSSFPFNEVGLSETEWELNPKKLLKSTKTVCSETLKTIFIDYLIKAEFPSEWKPADVTPSTQKRRSFPELRTAGLLVFFPVSQKILKGSYTDRKVHMLISFYQLLCAAIEKTLVHNKH